MNGFLIFAIAICVVAVIAFLHHYFSAKKVILRTLAKLPDLPVASLKSNSFSKITGKALHVKDPLIAPYSKRKCIFYDIKIEQKKSSGKSSYWKTLVHETKFQAFFVERHDHYVIVKPEKHPRNYISYLNVDKEQDSGTFNDPTPAFESLLNRYQIESKNFFGLFNKQLRYKEGIIEIGEQITVAGIAQWKTLSEPIPEYPYAQIASLEASEHQKIIITDLPEALVERKLRQL